MARFDSAIALAKRLIAKNGQPVTLRKFVTGVAPDPSKPWKPGLNTPVDTTVDAVFLGYERKYIDGTLIRTGDQKVYMPATATDGPDEGGVIVRGAETWKIIDIEPLNPNGQTVMYEIQVRR